MNSNDVQRYTRVFSKVDTDHDGKITGEQARQLFLSWQLPKGLLTDVPNGSRDLAEFAAVCIFYSVNLVQFIRWYKVDNV